MSRFALAAGLVVLLVVVGALASIPFLARGWAPTLGATEPITFNQTIGTIRGLGDIKWVDSSTVRIRLDLGGAGNRMTPRISLNMPDRAMEPVRLIVERLPDGRFEAVGTLPISGYWLLRIEVPEGWTDVGFRLPG